MRKVRRRRPLVDGEHAVIRLEIIFLGAAGHWWAHVRLGCLFIDGIVHWPRSGMFTVRDLIILRSGNSFRSSGKSLGGSFGVKAGETPSRNHLGCGCALGTSVWLPSVTGCHTFLPNLPHAHKNHFIATLYAGRLIGVSVMRAVEFWQLAKVTQQHPESWKLTGVRTLLVSACDRRQSRHRTLACRALSNQLGLCCPCYNSSGGWWSRRWRRSHRQTLLSCRGQQTGDEVLVLTSDFSTSSYQPSPSLNPQLHHLSQHSNEEPDEREPGRINYTAQTRAAQ